jgi:hypothetical protein
MTGRAVRMALVAGVTLTSLVLGCSQCSGYGECGAGEICLVANSCARICSADGGTACPGGQTCQVAEVYCSQRACETIDWVCQ